MSELLLLPENYSWSFSKLSSYQHCPMQFKLTYMTDSEDEGNAFSDFGLLSHSQLEEWANGFITLAELPDEYLRRYSSAVTHWFPPYPKGYAGKVHQLGLEYFQSFKGFGDEYEIVCVEEKFKTKIGSYSVSGIADLVLRNKITGEYMVIDYKTKSEDSMKKELNVYRKQLYIYARFIYEKFGVYPSEIAFEMIKSKRRIAERFSMDEYNATLRWIEDTIDAILMESEWKTCKSDYFCKFICGSMGSCPEWKEV